MVPRQIRNHKGTTKLGGSKDYRVVMNGHNDQIKDEIPLIFSIFYEHRVNHLESYILVVDICIVHLYNFRLAYKRN